MEATASVLIERPIDEVFAFLTDAQSMSKWVSGVSRASYVGAGREEGARIRASYIRGWKDSDIELQVTRYDAPKLFALQLVRGSFTFDGHFELTEEDLGSTRVTNFVEADADSLGSEIAMIVAGPFIRRSSARRLQRELEAMRTAILGG